MKGLLNGVFVGLVAGIVLSHLFLRAKSPAEPVKSDGVFILAVTLKFKNIAAKNSFNVGFAPLARYVADNEPHTLSYRLLQSDQDDLLVHIFERYSTKHDYAEVHKSSKEFLHFRGELTAMAERGEVEISGQSYTETSVGYMFRF